MADQVLYIFKEPVTPNPVPGQPANGGTARVSVDDPREQTGPDAGRIVRGELKTVPLALVDVKIPAGVLLGTVLAQGASLQTSIGGAQGDEAIVRLTIEDTSV